MKGWLVTHECIPCDWLLLSTTSVLSCRVLRESWQQVSWLPETSTPLM